MKGTAARFFRLAVSLTVLITVGWVLTGQAAKPVKHGVRLPTDWSHQHLIFSHPSTPERMARANADVRYRQQVQRRAQSLALTSRSDVATPLLRRRSHLTHQAATKSFNRDWSENLGTGSSAGAGNYPAKYSFDTTTAFCASALPPNQPDYVVYSTGQSGLTQASVVAYDNIYEGCGGPPTPNLYWAYNTGGNILTSPVLSLDGTQVAFVQTTGGLGGVASLVVLKWRAGDGTVGTPMTLVPTLAPFWPTCAAPCMIQVFLHDGSGGQVDDTTSSVFYDYNTDVAWVGGAFGWLHKLTGIFNGTPAEVNTGGFPVQVSAATSLSSPVYDRLSGNVFVSDSGGFLSRVSPTGGVVKSGQMDFSGRNIMAGPVVDSVAGKIYVFATDDGVASCTNGGAVDCTGVFQLSISFSAGDKGIEAVIGSSNAGKFPNPLFLGAFDSAYFEGPGATPTGSLYVCGNTGANATLYQIPVTGGVMSTTSNVITPLAGAISTAACSGVTDVPNPNLSKVPSERLFVSVANDAVPSPCGSAGCVLSFIDAPWVNNNVYAVGGQVLSTQLHVETVIQAGTSAFFAANPPTWTTQIAQIVTDGNPGDQVIWIDQGSLTAPFSTWVANTPYVTTLIKILDPNGNVQALTTAGTTGAGPTWNITPGGLTTDGGATWTNVGAIGTAALPMPGGTSGMIIDNTLGTFTIPGDSEIYFTTLTDQTACGTSGAGGCAVQASQTGLN
jgi:hypothetical protein